jgi:lipopolysaccharide biosynthesis glycosyltransferase
MPHLDHATVNHLAFNAVPVVNIGVLGYCSRFPQMLDLWRELMAHNPGEFMNDETSANILAASHDVVIMPNTWNKSVAFDDSPNDQAAILHYHGHRHAWLTECDASAWWRHLDSMIDTEMPAANIAKYLQSDKWIQAKIKEHLL